MALSEAKTLGGIGAILTLLLVVPYIGAVLVIVGWVLIIVAVRRISDEVQDKAIFNNALIAAICAIIAAVVLAVVVVGAVLGLIGLGVTSTTTTPPPGIFGVIAGLIAGLAVAWIVGVVGSYFLWKSFKEIGGRTMVGLFGTAGLIYFIGSILTIVLIGIFVVFIAQILVVAAFFSLPDNLQPPMTPAPMQPMPPPAPMPT